MTWSEPLPQTIWGDLNNQKTLLFFDSIYLTIRQQSLVSFWTLQVATRDLNGVAYENILYPHLIKLNLLNYSTLIVSYDIPGRS